jgi:transcriptional regulator with XRE-family HTH domain
MADEVRTRIKQVRQTLNISQRDFVKRIYISQTLLGEIELGNRNVNDRTIQLITTEFNVNKDWLLTGKGNMFSAPPVDLQLANLVEIFNQLDKGLKDYLLDQSKGLLKIQKTKTEKPRKQPRQNRKSLPPIA